MTTTATATTATPPPGRPPQSFHIDALTLESGEVLPDVELVFATHGRLAPNRDNVIWYPTWFMGRHDDNNWLIGPGRPLDPDRYFIVVPNMLGNGVSTSPSNAAESVRADRFPTITVRDQVRAQRLLVDALGITRLEAVVGWSMGACQAFQWAVSHPDLVQRILPFCGAARISEHNHVFLDGVAAAITADSTFDAGRYREQPLRGLRAAAHVYAGWGFSQPFYRDRAYEALGFHDRDDFVDRFWQPLFTEQRDANDVLSMIRTWKSADVGLTPGFHGDLETALGSIRARAVVLSAERDLYFCAEDQASEVAHLPGGEFRVIPGIWGHSAGVGLNPPDTAFIDAALADLLDT